MINFQKHEILPSKYRVHMVFAQYAEIRQILYSTIAAKLSIGY